MLVHKAYKFRLYPNKGQKIMIAKTIGCSRFVFNYFLDQWNTAYRETGKGLTYGSCSTQLTQLKRGLTWLKEVDSIALQSSLKNLADAYSRFFQKQNKAPRFKTKMNQIQSYITKQTNDNIAVIGNKLKLPKLGLLKFARSRTIHGQIVSATIRKTPSGKYYVSILVETEVQPFRKTDSAVGLDVGLNDFAVLSNGLRFPNPKFFRTLEKKLAKEQKKLSRRKELAVKRKCKLTEAKNYQKQRKKVSRIYEKMVNARHDYLHKGTQAKSATSCGNACMTNILLT